MRFAKYHGIGNDFVMLADPGDEFQLGPDFVRSVCDRRFGIGADGVIRVAPGTDGAEFFMDYVNADGSIGEMCGNGIRCVAVFARERGLTDAEQMTIGTRAGPKVVTVQGDRVRVDMGPPIFTPDEIPVRWDGSDALNAKVELADRTIEAACLSMGNPHAVTFVDEDVERPGDLGSQIERHEMFPNGTNVEFVRVIDPHRLRMRVWERGSGETLACGTGACASAVAARVLRGTEERVTVELRGGDLEIEWSGTLDRPASVFMTGPATKSFEGEFDLEDYR